MIKKVVSVLLIVILLGISSVQVIASSVSELQDRQQELQDQQDTVEAEKDKVTEEKNSVMDEVSELTREISQYESEISELEDQITDLENSIDEKEKEIKQLEEDTKERQEVLITRLVAMYEKGQTSYLDVLLSASDMTTFISSYYRIEEIAEADQEVIDSIIQKQQETEQTRQELEQEKKEVDESKKEVEQKNASLQSARAEKQAKVDSLSAEEQELQEKIDEFESAIQDAQDEIERIREEQAAQSDDGSGGGYIGSFEGTLSWPLSTSTPYHNYISSYFGPRESPTSGASSNHGAVDIPVSYAPVYAPAAGKVIIARRLSGYGNYIMIDHGNGYYTGFGHLSAYSVSEGQTVSRGQQIATSGNTGISTGPHLHYEVYIGGTANYYRVDPLQYTSHPKLYSL